MVLIIKRVLMLGFLGLALPAQAEDTDLVLPVPVQEVDIKQGKIIYDRLCIHCHLTSYDDKFGPGLAGIAERRSEVWLHEFLQNPSQMIKHDDYAKNLKENNSYNLTMPTLPEMKNMQKRKDVIAYLATLKG